MPASEQTWRDTKLLHKVFAISSVIMLIATIWMFVKDHNRPWKPYQRAMARVDIILNNWRKLQFETNEARRLKQDLEAAVQAARQEPVGDEPVGKFVERLTKDEATQKYVSQAEAVRASAGVAEERDTVLRRLNSIVAAIRTSEDTQLGILKFARANRDKAVADVGLALRDNKSAERQAELQQTADDIKEKVRKEQEAYDALKTQREALQQIVADITAEEDVCVEALAKHESNSKKLTDANIQRRSTYVAWMGPIPLPGKKWLELPILDAFNSPRKIDNLWSEDLMIEQGSFGKVRRFDRCTTCHQSMQKALPGSAVEPAYEHKHFIDFLLVADDLPEADPDSESGEQSPEALLEQYYGLMLAPEGLLVRDEVTLRYVRDESPAAKAEALGIVAIRDGAEIRESLLQTKSGEAMVAAGLQLGDVIARIDGDPVRDPQRVLFRLLDAAKNDKQPLTVTIQRGLPGPYTSHPRLDLFVGSLSPHKMADFACTVCHDGQGSATDFKWASHTPNTEFQRKEWVKEYGWFDNHHWIMPMYPKRFAEASCLKCHHEVTELLPNERFTEAPAPTVTHGYDLVRKYGCYGCHEVNGYDRGVRIGPDLRIEPNFFAAALQIKMDPGFASLGPEVAAWADELAVHPERDAVRHRIYEVLEADGEAEQPALAARTHSNLVPLFKDVESPGKLRKPGPSLRYAGHKMDSQFMFDWVRNPENFRPTTRMPQFFGMWDHLHKDDQGHVHDDATKFEPLETAAAVAYLRGRTQDFEYGDTPEAVEQLTAEAVAATAEELATKPVEELNSPLALAVQRGKVALQERGCLACHDHAAFPDTAPYREKDEIVQGPDLSAVGTKFAPDRNPNGRKWLYSWIKDPTRYHARTVMPDLFLDEVTDANGVTTNPAADIVAFLLIASRSDWSAEGVPASADDLDAGELDRLVLENLKDAFAEVAAERYSQEGIPAELRDELKGAEIELLTDVEGAVADGALTKQAKLMYLGRKTIAKYGCYGCHDIPGFEDAKPIGTALADWGRKDPTKLAFEHITHFLDEHESHADDGETEEIRDFYRHAIDSGHRSGFIYQKLRDPRSYDYHKTENKKYNERLRMPQFPFTAQEREAVITFVLGLVADPPAAKYIYQPDERQEAIIAGRQVLDKYNCGGCHMLEAESWSLAYEPGDFGAQSATSTFPFIKTHFPPDTLAKSTERGPSGLLHATVKGMPTLDDLGVPMANDDFGDPLEDDEDYDPANLEYPFDLWLPAAIEGNVFEVGVLPLALRSAQVRQQQSTRGGFLAKYLLRHVVEREKKVNPAAKGTEAWGWVPPPLLGEGEKVQTNWLHDFLLNPYPIRPAVVLRMPRFNMSPEEATKLVNYVAAIDNAEYPYESTERQQQSYLAAAESAYQQRLAAAGATSTRFNDAMNIVINNNYCVKCHLVGDFNPKGADRAKAPDLADVGSRLRPDYLRKWIANPKALLPYTSMPVNVPYNETATVFQPVPNQPALYHGSTTETVDALVDLLLNYDEYSKQRSPVAPMVDVPGDEAPAAAVVPSPVPATPAATTPPPQPTPPPAPPAEVSNKSKELPNFLKNLPEATGWGHLKVRFVYDGDPPSPVPIIPDKDPQYCGNFKLFEENVVVNRENGGIANVLAYLDKRSSKVEEIPIHESYLAKARDEVVLDNKGCRFEPRVTILWTPQTLLLKNSDSVGHNTNYLTFENPGENNLIPASGVLARELPKPEPRAAKVTCNIHPWMASWLLVKDHPYAAASGSDGMVEIKNLPAGTWTFQFWHEAEGYVADVNLNGEDTEWARGRPSFTIEDGKTTDVGVVKFAPKEE